MTVEDLRGGVVSFEDAKDPSLKLVETTRLDRKDRLINVTLDNFSTARP